MKAARWLFAGASLLALAGPAAHAAELAEPTATVETVIVTAEKREESIQETPVTVNVVSGAQIQRQNIIKLNDLARAVPALQLNSQTGGGFQIRGVGTYGFARSAESAVGAVVDGVVIPTVAGSITTNSMYDLARVEVLAGPQGTLFGKNASAGVINIVTNAPEFDHFEVIGHLDAAGRKNYVNGHLVANVPIASNAALRIGYHHTASGHLYYNAFLDKWDKSVEDGVRARLRWNPTDRLSVNLSADYTYVDNNGVNFFVGPEHYVDPASPLFQVLQDCGVTPGPKNNRVCMDTAGTTSKPSRTFFGGASMQIDYELGGYTLSSITAWHQYQLGDFSLLSQGGDTDSVPTPVFSRNITPIRRDSYTQEIKLVSPDDPDRLVSFVAGLFYGYTLGKDKVDQELGVPIGGGAFVGLRRGVRVRTLNTNMAAYGQADIHFTDKLTGIVGGRFTHEIVKDHSNALTFPDPGPPFILELYQPSFSFQLVNNKLEEDNFSWKLGAKYQFNPSTMGFFTVARGFKAGFINDQSTPIPANLIEVRPEHPTSSELGVKSTAFGRMATNLTVFYTKVDDFQTPIIFPPSCVGPDDPPGCTAVGTLIQGNAPHMTSKGVDFSFFGEPVDGLYVNGGVLYNRAHFASGFEVPCPASPRTECLHPGVNGRATGTTPALRQLPSTPKWKITFGAEYAREVGAGLEGFIQADGVYTTSFSYTAAKDPMTRVGDRFVLGARIGVRADDDRWSVGVFCRNCFDKRYPTLIATDPFSASTGGEGVSYVHNFTVDSYRLIGVSLSGRF